MRRSRSFGLWEPAESRCVACRLPSRAKILGDAVGIPIVTLEEAGRIDIDFDGADEVDPRLNLIKGYGGALVREKIVTVSSRRFIVLVGDEKMVRKLGNRGTLPVEVIPFGLPLATRMIKALGLKPQVREHDGKPYITDNGNLILDCGGKANFQSRAARSRTACDSRRAGHGTVRWDGRYRSGRGILGKNERPQAQALIR